MKYVDLDKDGVSFSRALSDHAVCPDCFKSLCLETIFEDRCPYCGAYIMSHDIVASLHGKKRSEELAIEESKRRKEEALKRAALKRFDDGVS